MDQFSIIHILFTLKILHSQTVLKPIQEIAELLSTNKGIVITHHQNPDGDAIGSSLALYHFLKKMGHQVTVVSPNDFPEFLKWMPGADEVLIYDQQMAKASKVFEESGVLFSLDYNTPSRTRDMAGAVEHFSGVKILIDHHLNPDTDFYDYGISIPHKSSTCEMVYDLIVEWGKKDILDQQMAACLYTGLITDTHSFKFSSTGAGTHLMAASLLNLGIPHTQIQERVLDAKEEGTLRLTGLILKERMLLLEEYHTSVITVTREDMERYHIKNGGTEGLVNIPLSLKNILFSIFIKEDMEELRLSLRSQGNFDVSEIASAYFQGGGHKNASGGRAEMSMEQAIDTIKNFLPNYKKQIEKCYEELSTPLFA